MAVIHRTTLVPGKLDLLTAWLPAQQWYVAHADAPSLARVGGFRLDDPAGRCRTGRRPGHRPLDGYRRHAGAQRAHDRTAAGTMSSMQSAAHQEMMPR